MLEPSAALGVYLHIPYCSAICHYCDFAKTARWDTSHTDAYFKVLTKHLGSWCASLLPEVFPAIYTLNIGGGTPSLFVEEYRQIMTVLAPFLASESEQSIEANPRDCSLVKLQSWGDLGFNRLSLGVQSFDPRGLKLLKRDHDGHEARESIGRALQVFDNVNVDLIYNWPGQSPTDFLADLEQVLAFGVPHLSLYDLCYPAKTPLGRQLRRGRIVAPSEEKQELLYRLAGERLEAEGYIHDEVSNWTKPGFLCKHNWLYWQGGYYLGVGAGAHGYLPAAGHPYGRRYAYESSDRRFERLPAPVGNSILLTDEEAKLYGLRFEQRDARAWLYEYIGSATRCRLGLDMDKVAFISGFNFVPTELIRSALGEGKLQLQGRCLLLDKKEWIREIWWCEKIIDCFAP